MTIYSFYITLTDGSRVRYKVCAINPEMAERFLFSEWKLDPNEVAIIEAGEVEEIECNDDEEEEDNE